uniref:T9SS type A sorting domain-containing protein n=1 Tax=Ignavibacterium album TaxID=591197 RepID=A0A7V2ZL34_9BACT
MKQSFNIIFYLIIAFISSNLFSQTSQQPGTFLKLSDMDSYYPFGKNLIEVFDIENDGSKEVFIMIKDTLVCLQGDSIRFIKPLIQTNSAYYISSIKLQECDEKRLVILSATESGNLWAYYYPVTNNVSSGVFYYPRDFSFLPFNNCNFWYNDLLDTSQYLVEGIFNSNDIYQSGWLIKYVGEGDSLFNLYYWVSTSPLILFKSKNENFVSSVFIGENIFTSGNPHGIYRYYTNDGGFSWSGEIMMRGNINLPVSGQVVNRNLLPHLKEFGYFDGMIDNNGVLHIALYGIGYKVQNFDTTEVTPVLYWNSNDKKWIAVSDPKFENLVDDFGNQLINYSPMYCYGLSLPSIAVSDDGQIVMIAWSSPEYNVQNDLITLNIYPGDNSQYSTQIYYTDYFANISFDGGKTWDVSRIFPVKNSKNLSEVFLSLNKKLDFDQNLGKVKADFFYIIDEIPGNANFFQNSSSINPLYYDSLIISTTGFISQSVYPNDYVLSQNYPNPFNNTTTIEFSIPQNERVRLVIYDLLGQEVVKLIDEEKNPGKHKIIFNGYNLASGIYFYVIEAGKFKAIKKMLLLK